MCSKFIYRKPQLSDVPKLKYIRDHVSENKLVSIKIDEQDHIDNILAKISVGSAQIKMTSP